MLKNNKGFSLIELMVVVAIIAILATIAIPSYQGFQAKARQKEGFALLNAYYTSSQATFAEIGFFPGNFVASGFAPTGQLGYRVTAMNHGTAPMFGSNDPACLDTTNDCDCAASPVQCPNFKTWAESALAGGSGIGPAAPMGPGSAPLNDMMNMFTTVTSGIVRNGGEVDTYTIDELKNLVMRNDGLN